jgi:hypothetical protein
MTIQLAKLLACAVTVAAASAFISGNVSASPEPLVLAGASDARVAEGLQEPAEPLQSESAGPFSYSIKCGDSHTMISGAASAGAVLLQTRSCTCKGKTVDVLVSVDQKVVCSDAGKPCQPSFAKGASVSVGVGGESSDETCTVRGSVKYN